MSKLILLDGPMGAGKTTVSSLLSRKFEFKHLDIDNLKTPYKSWPAGYIYTEHLPIINQLAKSIVSFNLPLTNIIIDKSLGKTTAGEFIDIAKNLNVVVFKIMLWVDLETSKKRAFERKVTRGLDLTTAYQEMVIGSWQKALDYKNNSRDLIIIDTSETSPEEVVAIISNIIKT